MNMMTTPAVASGPSRYSTDSSGLMGGTTSTDSGRDGEDPGATCVFVVSSVDDVPGAAVFISFSSSLTVAVALLKLWLLDPFRTWILS